MCAVRRPHLDEAGAGLGHHIGHAESAADLDQLTPGDHDGPVAGERREHEEDGRGAVVDDQRGLGACGPGE